MAANAVGDKRAEAATRAREVAQYRQQQAVLVGALIGLLLGILAALKHNTIWDTIATIISVIGVSVPSYVFALGLAYCFGFKIRAFPLLYDQTLPFKSSVLPSIALCMFTIASIARFTRSEMLEVLGSDYILLAERVGIFDIKSPT